MPFGKSHSSRGVCLNITVYTDSALICLESNYIFSSAIRLIFSLSYNDRSPSETKVISTRQNIVTVRASGLLCHFDDLCHSHSVKH